MTANYLYLLLALMMTGVASGAQLPEGSGKASVQKICSGCHAAEIVMGRHETKAGWEQIVGDMVEKGANGTDDEFNTIIDYLAVHFPKEKASGGGSEATRVQRSPADAAEGSSLCLIWRRAQRAPPGPVHSENLLRSGFNSRL